MSQGNHAPRPRWLLLRGILGAVFIAAAVLVTPTMLIRAGFLETGLAHVDPAIRTFAHVSVLVTRLIVSGLGAGLILLAMTHGVGRWWQVSQNAEKEDNAETEKVVGNYAFGWMFAFWMMAMALIWFGGNVWASDEILKINREVIPKLAGLGFLAACGLGCGLTFRVSRWDRRKMFGHGVMAIAFGLIGFELLGVVWDRGELFGLAMVDAFSLLILAYFVGTAVLRASPALGSRMEQIGFPLATVGLAVGACLMVTISGRIFGWVFGVPFEFGTDFLRIGFLAVGAVVLMDQLRLQTPRWEGIVVLDRSLKPSREQVEG